MQRSNEFSQRTCVLLNEHSWYTCFAKIKLPFIYWVSQISMLTRLNLSSSSVQACYNEVCIDQLVFDLVFGLLSENFSCVAKIKERYNGTEGKKLIFCWAQFAFDICMKSSNRVTFLMSFFWSKMRLKLLNVLQKRRKICNNIASFDKVCNSLTFFIFATTLRMQLNSM